ncbi:hypothetical protein BDW22DRAFT_75735 [Trametopsis cervina]|nr:hypothetical protein BDW22DRAFT_75735 [Trametopsis cervina]
MAPEIRFTSFGIPYLVEFANVTFRRRHRKSRQPQSTVYAHSNDSDWSFASFPSDKNDAYAVHETDSESESEEETSGPEGEGLWIRFASQVQVPTPYAFPLSESRLTRLKYRIAKAVVAAGMESSPNMEAPDPFNHALKKHDVLPSVPVSSFYRGTYGQVMEAIQSAGLVVSQCEESGFSGATFLGALFVGRQTSSGGVELMKLSLWA